MLRPSLPNDPTDPDFGRILRESHSLGVQILPIISELIDWDLRMKRIIPYDLEYFTKTV